MRLKFVNHWGYWNIISGHGHLIFLGLDSGEWFGYKFIELTIFNFGIQFRRKSDATPAVKINEDEW